MQKLVLCFESAVGTLWADIHRLGRGKETKATENGTTVRSPLC